MSKFKVGDKVKIIDAGYSYTTFDSMADKLTSLSNGKAYRWERGFARPNYREMNGMIGEIVALYDKYALVNLTFHWTKRSIIFDNSETVLQLLKQEDFTFEEVIARIKEGEVYVPLDKSYATKSIAKRNSGNIIITFHKRVDGCVPTYTKYKLVRQKKEYKLYEVEHKEDGKRYLFRSDLDHTLDDMVVCDTCRGKSYGKMVKVVTKELTEEEYKAYKPIVKIISKDCPF